MSLLYKVVLGTRMSLCVALLLILPEQGRPQCYMPDPRGTRRVASTCCTNISASPINKRFDSCYEHNETAFPDCRVHAFIFITPDKRGYCVDPAAKWLPTRFKRLENRGICCQRLHQI